MISQKTYADTDRESLRLITAALEAAGKFCYTAVAGEEFDRDLQLIDWTLIESALASADACR